MSRTSDNEYAANGRLINGYDYDRQAWVQDGRYVRCGHPESMDCKCWGREHEGLTTCERDVLVSIERTLNLVEEEK